MTIPEIEMALDGDIEKGRPPSCAKAVAHGADYSEIMAYAERLRNMTPRERFEEARNG